MAKAAKEIVRNSTLPKSCSPGERGALESYILSDSKSNTPLLLKITKRNRGKDLLKMLFIMFCNDKR